MKRLKFQETRISFYQRFLSPSAVHRTHRPGFPATAVLESRELPDARYHRSDPHPTVKNPRHREEKRRGGRCRRVPRQEPGELLVLLMLMGRRQPVMGMMELVVLRVLLHRAPAQDVLYQEGRSAGGGRVLVRLLLVASRLHCPAVIAISRRYYHTRPITISHLHSFPIRRHSSPNRPRCGQSR